MVLPRRGQGLLAAAGGDWRQPRMGGSPLARHGGASSNGSGGYKSVAVPKFPKLKRVDQLASDMPALRTILSKHHGVHLKERFGSADEATLSVGADGRGAGARTQAGTHVTLLPSIRQAPGGNGSGEDDRGSIAELIHTGSDRAAPPARTLNVAAGAGSNTGGARGTSSSEFTGAAAAAAQELAAAKRERSTLRKALDRARRDAADGDGRMARLARAEGELDALRAQYNATVTARGRLEGRFADLEREAQLFDIERSVLKDMASAFELYKEQGILQASLDGFGGERPPGHSMAVVEQKHGEALVDARTYTVMLNREQKRLVHASARVAELREERDACIHDSTSLEIHARGVDKAADNAADSLRVLREEVAAGRKEFALRLSGRRAEIKRLQKRKIEEEKERIKREEMLAGSRRPQVVKERRSKVKNAANAILQAATDANAQRLDAKFCELQRLACPHVRTQADAVEAIITHFKGLNNSEETARRRTLEAEDTIRIKQQELKHYTEMLNGGKVAGFRSWQERRAIDEWDRKIELARKRIEAARARYVGIVSHMEILRHGLGQLSGGLSSALRAASGRASRGKGSSAGLRGGSGDGGGANDDLGDEEAMLSVHREDGGGDESVGRDGNAGVVSSGVGSVDRGNTGKPRPRWPSHSRKGRGGDKAKDEDATDAAGSDTGAGDLAANNAGADLPRVFNASSRLLAELSSSLDRLMDKLADSVGNKAGARELRESIGAGALAGQLAETLRLPDGSFQGINAGQASARHAFARLHGNLLLGSDGEDAGGSGGGGGAFRGAKRDVNGGRGFMNAAEVEALDVPDRSEVKARADRALRARAENSDNSTSPH